MSRGRRHTPIRTCVGCRRRAPQAELLRLAVGADACVGRAPAVRASGRSAYVHERITCMRGLASGRSLSRSLRVRVSKAESRRLAEELIAETEGA